MKKIGAEDQLNSRKGKLDAPGDICSNLTNTKKINLYREHQTGRPKSMADFNQARLQTGIKNTLRQYEKTVKALAMAADVRAAVSSGPASIVKGRTFVEIAMDDALDFVESLVGLVKKNSPDSDVATTALPFYHQLIVGREAAMPSKTTVDARFNAGWQNKARMGVMPVKAMPDALTILTSSNIPMSPAIDSIKDAWEEVVSSLGQIFETEATLLANGFAREVSAAFQTQIAKEIHAHNSSGPVRIKISTGKPTSNAGDLVNQDPVAEATNKAKKGIEEQQEAFILGRQLEALDKKRAEIKARLKALNAAPEDEEESIAEKIERAGLQGKALKEAERELKRLEEAHGPEKSNILTYLEWMSSIPWNKRSEMNFDVAQAEEILNRDHFGMERVKDAILDHIAVQSRTHAPARKILCLVGPPGVGKTSICKSIAEAENREYARLSLGGVTDEAALRGHIRTYIGALPGRLVKALRDAGTKNPLIVLDEVDKMGTSYKGDPSNALLEILDPEQNRHFEDHYLGVPMDLSEAMFICTANDLSTIPGPVRDRMEIIRLPGYSQEEKFEIARKYLVPKQMKANGLTDENISITDGALKRLILAYTHEAGVRNLERMIDRLCRKAVRSLALSKSDFIEINEDNIADFAGPPRVKETAVPEEDSVGIVNGLSYSTVGGSTLQIEAQTLNNPDGKGLIVEITGQLGDVMKESVKIATTVVTKMVQEGRINSLKPIEQTRIHIHALEGAVPKDGPSAGLALASVITSAITGIKTNRLVAMTGEITAYGKAKAIGGLPEKLDGAARDGATTVIIPKANVSDLHEVPQSTLAKLKIIPVTTIEEVLDIVLTEKALQPRPSTVVPFTNAADGLPPADLPGQSLQPPTNDNRPKLDPPKLANG